MSEDKTEYEKGCLRNPYFDSSDNPRYGSREIESLTKDKDGNIVTVFKEVKYRGRLMDMRTKHGELTVFFDWAVASKHPDLQFVFSIPHDGYRTIKTNIKLKAEGYKLGLPDICLPIAKSGYHGLYIYMLLGKKKPTTKQRVWMKFLRGQGFLVQLSYRGEFAKEVVMEYLGIGSDYESDRGI